MMTPMSLLAGDRRVAWRHAGRAFVLTLLALALAGCASGGPSWSWTARRTVPGGEDIDAVACPSPTACVALVGTVQSV
jgi:hypothetical protein